MTSNGGGPKPNVLVGELQDNPGTTVRNATEEVARAIKRKLVPSGQFDLYEYATRGLPSLAPTFYKINWRGAKRFSMPTWEVVDPLADPFLRSAKKLVRSHNYTAEALKRERHVKLIDGRDDTPWEQLLRV
jgi:hypothetical protein